VEFRVLGPLAIVRDGSELPTRGRRLRLVLALLLVNAGRMVPAERLVEDIWGRDARGTGPLRTYVWQLRRLLRDGRHHGDRSNGVDVPVLVSRAGGYLLDIDRDQLDANRFEAQVAAARALAVSGRPQPALAHVDAALRLWRGPVFGDLTTALCLRGDVTRMEELLLDAQELRAELLLATGRHAHAIAELKALAGANAERERRWVLLMTALYQAGRQSEALRCFQEARTRLVDEVGIEPGRELRALEQAVLRQDPSLDGHPPPGGRYGELADS
jgi:DNA-binding SARP family transcriptional activator